MAGRSTSRIWLAVVIFVLVAVGIRFLGASLIDALPSLHGGAGH